MTAEQGLRAGSRIVNAQSVLPIGHDCIRQALSTLPSDASLWEYESGSYEDGNSCHHFSIISDVGKTHPMAHD